MADASKQTAALKAKAPFTQTDLNKELAKIKGQVRGVDFSVKPKDTTWAVTPKAAGKTGKPFEVGKQGDEDKGKGQLDDIDTPVKFVDKSHTIRVHFTGERAVLLMASDQFTNMRQKLDAFSNTYMTPFREIGANDVANQIEDHINTVKGVIDSGELDINTRLEGVTGDREADVFRRASIYMEAARQISSRLKDAVRELGEKLSAGKLGRAILGVAGELKPGDPIVYNDDALVVTEVKKLEEYQGKYEFLFRARSADGQFLSPLLYREEGIRWHIADKPHHEPFQPLGGVPGGRVVIDKPHLNTGTSGDTNPPFYNQTVGGKTYNRRGHVVAFVFGGPHNINTNIVALTHAANNQMNSSVESPLAKEIRTNDSVYEYIAEAKYPGGDTTKPVGAIEIRKVKIYPTKESQSVETIPND